MSVNPPVIAGVVVDAKGNPVEGARVYFIEGPVPLPDIAALTDDAGRFRLTAPVPGNYELEVASELSQGFVRKMSRFDVREEESLDLVMRLDT